ncbi:MAG: prepilin-type N-terminal cleavage/methylation domain-containing protein [Patescibacteria group bacterium]
MAEYNNIKGQSLVEIIIAMAIGTILIGASVGSIVLLLKYNLNTKTVQIASSLNRQMMDDIRSISESDWLNIYNKNKGVSNQYYISSSTRQIVSGAESLIIEGRQFSRYFYIENVSRDAGNNIEVIYNSVNDDPSTQKIAVIVQWGGGGNIKEVQYLTRFRNAVFVQTDWSGGFNQEIFATTSAGTIINGKFATSSSNIDFSSTPGSIRLILP